MQIIDYSDKDLVLTGDLHGEFRTLVYMLKDSGNSNHRKRKYKIPGNMEIEKIENCVLLVCGDCGIGFNKHEYYEIELAKLQKELEKKNIILLLLRGNHDDPEYFETVDGKFNFPNIKFVPDYSILKTKENVSLCIGGAISYDRSWRLKENVRLNKYRKTTKKLVYWEDEGVKENPDIINDLKNNGIEIDSIITHTIPYSYLPNHSYKDFTTDNQWFYLDKTVKEDIVKESLILDMLAKDLIDNNQPLKWWAFGHTHRGEVFPSLIKTYRANEKNVCLINLNILSSLEPIKDISGIFGNVKCGITSASNINGWIRYSEEEERKKKEMLKDGIGELKGDYTFKMNSAPLWTTINHSFLDDDEMDVLDELAEIEEDMEEEEVRDIRPIRHIEIPDDEPHHHIVDHFNRVQEEDDPFVHAQVEEIARNINTQIIERLQNNGAPF